MMKARKLFYKECHLAGHQYHDADEVWEQLHVGFELKFVRDLDNRHTKDAVAVVFEGKMVNSRMRIIFSAIFQVVRIRGWLSFLTWGGVLSSSVVFPK